MDLTSILMQQMAAQQAAQPAHVQPRPNHQPVGFRTQLVNGRWVLVPTAYGRKTDPALAPRVYVKPLHGGKLHRLPRGR